MLVKEYRILIPLNVEEYKIAQLYMIAKKSRVDSSGKEHGVVIMKNEPYEDGPGGSGQYTYKVYHIGSRIPAWIRSILPSSALEAHEEAWNAYPYTKTRYSSPVLGDRFNIEVETYYVDDAGAIENKFNLSSEEYKNCTIDVLDFVKDPIPTNEYSVEEDPKIYESSKTQRGPLTENWIEVNLSEKRPVMCAYKLCRVEFRYWGLQTRAERWIHELALRGTMLRAHRQAWAWQDEWVGLDINDIRKYEEETAEYLSSVMASSPSPSSTKKPILHKYSTESQESYLMHEPELIRNWDFNLGANNHDKKISSIEEERVSLVSDTYFDCCDDFPVEASESTSTAQLKQPLVRWNSELLADCCETDHLSNTPTTPKFNNQNSLLILVFHSDLFPNTSVDSKVADINTLKSTLEYLVTSHYLYLKGRVHILCVKCGSEFAPVVSMMGGIFSSIFHPSFALLLSSNAQLFAEGVQSTIRDANKVVRDFMESEEGSGFVGEIFAVGDFIGGIFLYESLSKSVQEITNAGPYAVSRNLSSASTQSSPYCTTIGKEATSPNSSSRSLYNYSFSESPESKGKSRETSEESTSSATLDCQQHSQRSSIKLSTGSFIGRNMSAPPVSSGHPDTILSFRPAATFLLGCPLAQLLVHRKLSGKVEDLDLRIDCDQLFNIFYSLDACGMRLEPVLNSQLSLLPPLQMPRYQRYPRGDGQSIHFDHSTHVPMIWGDRRVDHQMFCPQEMNNLPLMALPNILHASYWESKDFGSFLLRQFTRFEDLPSFSGSYLLASANDTPLEFQIPSANWNRKRSRFKVANLSANHRANDVIVVEGSEQIIHARFCYGPMDLVALSLETILVYVCQSGGEWFHHCTETTDKSGRLIVSLGTLLPVGVHSVRLIVQGDRSFVAMFVAVVPPKIPVVVFSIDGSLTCSMSVTGRDPRLRPGAVDLVRFWQQQGYIIIYLTARPDFSQRLVSAWLNQHHFPHGLLFFTPSISTDPLRQKAQYLRHLVDISVKIQAAYGSAKDVQVYTMAGLTQNQIFTVGRHKRRGCTLVEEGYSHHLHELQTGKISIAQPACATPDRPSSRAQMFFPNSVASPSAATQHSYLSRTTSFTPRSGKYRSEKCDAATLQDHHHHKQLHG